MKKLEHKLVNKDCTFLLYITMDDGERHEDGNELYS